MDSNIKVFLIDKSKPTLLMLNLWLDNLDNVEIVGSALSKSDFVEKVNLSEADVVIYNWNLSKKGYDQIKQLKEQQHSPAFLSIKDGNYLPLEGVMNQTPEVLIPTTSSLDSLTEAIERIAQKRTSVVKYVEDVQFEKAC